MCSWKKNTERHSLTNRTALFIRREITGTYFCYRLNLIILVVSIQMLIGAMLMRDWKRQNSSRALCAKSTLFQIVISFPFHRARDDLKHFALLLYNDKADHPWFIYHYYQKTIFHHIWVFSCRKHWLMRRLLAPTSDMFGLNLGRDTRYSDRFLIALLDSSWRVPHPKCILTNWPQPS
jgi:hypothetical protein